MIKQKFIKLFSNVENIVVILFLFLLTLIPIAEVVMRSIFKTGFPSSSSLIAHAVVWVTFLSGMLTSRSKDHLSLSLIHVELKEPWKTIIDSVNSLLGASITIAFSISSLSMILIAFDPSETVGPIPIKLATSIIPIGYAAMAVRFVYWNKESRKVKYAGLFGIIIGVLLSLPPIINILTTIFTEIPLWVYNISDIFYSVLPIIKYPLILILIIGGLLGTPIYILLGGIAYILFAANWGSLEVLPLEAYDLLKNDAIPAIPLFTFTGFILSESNSGKRLVNFFEAWFGWLPGGLSVMAILVCAFFTTFTGASGVTILALGGLLSYALIESGGFPKNFSIGLLTSSGSIGLLFPPSLPIILYGVMAHISIKDMFIGGVIPGTIMVLALVILGIRQSYKSNIKRINFSLKVAIYSLKDSLGEILLPLIILLSYFGGITTIVETSAISVLYSIILVVFIQKDMKFKELFSVMLKCLPIIGGVLIILAMARGLNYYIIDTEIPMKLTGFVQTYISSKYIFLIILNIILLLAGCLMDIYSAILVIGPLIIPLGQLYGIDPVHLGIIFLANLELGYLTPPVGINLFLASYRFETPIIKIYKMIIPYFIILFVMVLLITYVPWLSTGLLSILN